MKYLYSKLTHILILGSMLAFSVIAGFLIQPATPSPAYSAGFLQTNPIGYPLGNPTDYLIYLPIIFQAPEPVVSWASETRPDMVDYGLVTRHNWGFEEINDNTWYYAFEFVNNTKKNAANIQVTFDVENESGQIILTDTQTAYPYILAPGQRACVEFSFSNWDRSIDTEIKTRWQWWDADKVYDDYANIQIISHQLVRSNPDFLTGQVENKSSSYENVFVGAVFYDQEHNILDCHGDYNFGVNPKSANIFKAPYQFNRGVVDHYGIEIGKIVETRSPKGSPIGSEYRQLEFD